jgi:DNA-binding transcriptional LysR family regulator
LIVTVALNLEIAEAVARVLEDGDALIGSVRRGPDGTVEGSRFLTHARNVLAAVTVARRAQLSETTELKGSIRVGLTYTVSGYFLPRHYARFTRNYPDIRIELNELPRAAIEEGVNDGTPDIAVMLVSNLEDRERIAWRRCFDRDGGSGCRSSTRCSRRTRSTSPTSRRRPTSC